MPSTLEDMYKVEVVYESDSSLPPLLLESPTRVIPPCY